MERSLTIDHHFRGPPRSGNGGYVAGRLASFVGNSVVAVKLRRPPPLDRQLEVKSDENGCVRLLDGDALVASACPATLSLTPPHPPGLEEARLASAGYYGFRHHIFPECFVCGPARGPGDGMRIFAGPVGQRELVAAPWTPCASLTDGSEHVKPEYVWAALDCPGYFAINVGDQRPAVLGSITAALLGELQAGQACVVSGWPISSEGRRHRVGTAVHTAAGELIGVAEAEWIEIRSLDSFQ